MVLANDIEGESREYAKTTDVMLLDIAQCDGD